MCDSLVSEKNQLLKCSTTEQAHLKKAESALDQTNAKVDRLTSRLAGLQGDRNWLITNSLVGAFEYLCQSECQQTDRITPEFQENRGKLNAEMVDALEAACSDPLPTYA
ncbi:hypothetical protein Hanom_Chr02g00116841 [Helianthus anomalus]